MKALVIEDDQDSAALMSFLIKRSHPECEVFEARGWRDCREMHKQSLDLDLVVMDCMLIDGTCVDAWREIENHLLRPSTLWVCSALDSRQAKVLADQISYPHEFIRKPINPMFVKRKLSNLSIEGTDKCSRN